MSYTGFGQNQITAENYKITFLKDSLKVNVGQFGFNSFTVYNNSNNNLSLAVKINLPFGWTLINQIPPILDILAGQSTTIPLRVSPSAQSIGNINYPVSVILSNNFTNSEEVFTFFTRINQIVKWNASLPNQILNITKNDSLPRFTVKIQNSGNKKELFLVDFKTSLRLSHSSSGTQILLDPGKDTTLQVYIKSRSELSTSNTVQVEITSREGSKQLQQNVFFISDVYMANPSKYANLILNTSFYGLNMLNDFSRFGFAEFDGFYDLGKLRNINFRYRSNALSNSDNFAPNFKQINYESPRFKASVGSQLDFMNYQIDGNGINLRFNNNDRQNVELFGIKSRIGNVDMIGYRNEIVIGKQNILKSHGLVVRDNKFESTNFFGLHTLQVKLTKNQRLSLVGGYSTEKAVKIGELEYGYAYGYRYEANSKKIKLKSNYVYYSPFFPGITRGMLITDHELRVGLRNLYFGPYYDNSYRKPIIYTNENTVASETFQFSNQSLGGRLGFNLKRSSFELALAAISMLQDSMTNPQMNGYKTTFIHNFTKGRFNHSLNAVYTRSTLGNFRNGNITPAYSLFMNTTYKNLGFMGSYEYGPNFYFDYLYQAQTGINTERKNFSLFYEAKTHNSNLIDRINLGYMQFYKDLEPILLLRNDININLPLIRGSLDLISAVNLLKPKSSPMLSVVFKRTFNVPMAITPKYHTIKLFLFKDENDNEIFDKGEEAIENANLIINGNNVLTNKNGFATYKNTEKGQYIVDYRNIHNLRGWIAKGGIRDTVNLEGNISIGIPFKKSKTISGKVTYKQTFSSEDSGPSLNGILVVAVNRKGEIFKAITNYDGEFFFNLNDDIYNIQVPNNVFGNNLTIEKSIKTVDLRTLNTTELEFKIIQKKREINIKKQ
jgi:hypothetical protein